jgi:septal ring factor EnvC (AmiA/AmiB activator)
MSRQNRDSGSPAVQRPRGNRDSGVGQTPRPRQPAALPPYEPPTCPLNESAKRSLANITTNLDLRKYEKHLNAAVKNLTDFAGESNDYLYASQERVRRMAAKREAAQDDSEKTEAEEEAEQRAREMERKVEKLTKQSEKALRDLIDYKQELAQQDELLQKVSDKAAAASIAASASAAASSSKAARKERKLDQSSDDEDGSSEPPAEDEDTEMGGTESQAAILSPTELLKKAREEYQTAYTSKTLRAR